MLAPVFITARIPPWGPILTASSNPNYLPETRLQTPSLLRVSLSTGEFWRDTNIQSQTLLGIKNAQLQTPRAQVALMVKNLPANAGDIRDTGSIPGLGRYPGEGLGNLLQYSCLENSMDRGAWWPTVYGVAKSRTWLKRLSSALQTPWREVTQDSILITESLSSALSDTELAVGRAAFVSLSRGKTAHLLALGWGWDKHFAEQSLLSLKCFPPNLLGSHSQHTYNEKVQISSKLPYFITSRS